MTDPTDIVTRLRVLNHHAKKLAENESLHDLHQEAFTRCEELTWQAANEIERLRKERDEARQMYCKLWELPWRTGGIKKAKELGWDCFKDGDIQRQKILDEIKAAEMTKNDALDRLAKLDEELGLI